MTHRVCGIYAITHKPSGRSYVGRSVDIFNRWREHQYELSSCRHQSPKLQEAWATDGPSAFEFVVLEVVNAEELVAAEGRWLGTEGHGQLNERGTAPQATRAGRLSYLDRLTWSDIEAIRRAHQGGEGASALARRYGTSTSTMYAIVHGKSYAVAPAGRDDPLRLAYRAPTNSTLDPETVRHIRRCKHDERLSNKAIAHRFGVKAVTISNVLRGHNWGWVTNDDGTPYAPTDHRSKAYRSS